MDEDLKPSLKEKSLSFAKKHRLHIGIAVAIVVISIFFIIVYSSPDSFRNWSSPDYKLFNKSNLGRVKRSDSGNDGWDKNKLTKFVAKFNSLAK